MQNVNKEKDLSSDAGPVSASRAGAGSGRKDVSDFSKVGSVSPQCKSGDHCPDCFNAGYDTRDSALTQANKEALRDAAREIADNIAWLEDRAAQQSIIGDIETMIEDHLIATSGMKGLQP